MLGDRELPVPLRADRGRWASVGAERTVLGVVHNITSATRLLDLLTAFAGDRRVQVFFTVTGSSAFDGGTREFLAERGMLCVPWEVAIGTDFDVAISTSRGGDLHELRTPLIYTPHGAGYNKYSKPEAGSRKPEAGSRKPEAFGLTPEWLMHEGRVVPSVIVLSHEEQLRRLKGSCPEAVPVSTVAGDPCLDQLRASRPFRDGYRAALGIRAGQKLVVVTSTWGPDSLVAPGNAHRDVLRAALAELPHDDFRILAAVHPNAWYGHGSWQIQNWLAPLTEHGLLLPPPETETWKAALVAADYTIGDHGSLTMYAFASGVPVLLGSFSESTVAARSPMAALSRELPRYDHRLPLLGQLETAAAGQCEDSRITELRSLATSRPGQSAALLRRLFYRQLGLTEPDTPAAARTVPLPAPPGHGSSALVPSPAVVHPPMYASASPAGSRILVRRFPAALQRGSGQRHLAGAHLVADADDPGGGWVGSADVLVLPPGRPLHSAGADAWRALLRNHPGAALLSVAEASGGVLVLLPDGRRLRAAWLDPRPWWASADIAASVVHDRVVCATGDLPPGDVRFEVTTGSGASTGRLRVTALPSGDVPS